MRTFVRSITLLSAAALVPVLAHADTFTLMSVPGGSAPNPFSLSFTLPASPTTATGFTAQIYGFYVTTPVIRNGTTDPSDILTFYNTANFGGLADNASALFPFGPQLFSGPNSAPIFTIGTFNLSNESATGQTDYILTIAASSTPEPSSLVLLGTGALGLAGAARRRFVR